MRKAAGKREHAPKVRGDASCAGKRARARKDPQKGVGAKAERVPSRGGVALHARPSSNVNESRSNAPALLSASKGASLLQVGKTPDGRVIPHKRSERMAAIVRKHAVAGTDENTLCTILNIRPGQLHEYYGRELDTAVAQVNADVGQAIVGQAKRGHPVLARFYAKVKMGWRDGENATTPVSAFNIHIHE